MSPQWTSSSVQTLPPDLVGNGHPPAPRAGPHSWVGSHTLWEDSCCHRMVWTLDAWTLACPPSTEHVLGHPRPMSLSLKQGVQDLLSTRGCSHGSVASSLGAQASTSCLHFGHQAHKLWTSYRPGSDLYSPEIPRIPKRTPLAPVAQATQDAQL